MLMPPMRFPSGAPVPVGVAPTSSRTNDGGVKWMICQRSTFVVKPPAFTKVGGAGASIVQRVTRTSSGRTFHLNLGIHERRIADGARMHECQMRQVQQVVGDQLPVCLGMQIARRRAPGGIVEPMEIRDRRRISK